MVSTKAGVIDKSTASNMEQRNETPMANRTNKTSNVNSKSLRQKLSDWYYDYIARQQTQKVYWYMKVIIVIPCVYMVLSIMAMAQLVDTFEYYAGFTMLLFYANVCVHIVGSKSRVYIPLYYFSLLLMILIPAITYFITQ